MTSQYNQSVLDYLDRRAQQLAQTIEKFDGLIVSASPDGRHAAILIKNAETVIHADGLQVEVKRIREMSLHQLQHEYVPSLVQLILTYRPKRSSNIMDDAADLIAHEVRKDALSVASNVLTMSGR